MDEVGTRKDLSSNEKNYHKNVGGTCQDELSPGIAITKPSQEAAGPISVNENPPDEAETLPEDQREPRQKEEQSQSRQCRLSRALWKPVRRIVVNRYVCWSPWTPDGR